MPGNHDFYPEMVYKAFGARSGVHEIKGYNFLVLADRFAGLHEREILHRALATLDADHRVAVVLRYIADLAPAEIAARTGEREGTVKSRLHYALRQMRAALDAAERAPGGSR